MGIVTINQQDYAIEGIIFDKDDTLIEFDCLWGPRTESWVASVVDTAQLPHEAKGDLYRVLGYSPEEAMVQAESPLAIASIETLSTLVAGVLYQRGIHWHQAYAYAKETARNTILGDFDPQEIQPKGNIEKVMRQLAQAHIKIAVITSDDRSMTEKTLSYLGVSDLVETLICGDDPFPNKPAPEAIHYAAAEWGISPNAMMMVGDTLNDMQFAINAGAKYRIGVTSHSGDKTELASMADTLITSIDEIIPVK